MEQQWYVKFEVFGTICSDSRADGSIYFVEKSLLVKALEISFIVLCRGRDEQVEALIIRCSN